MDPVAFNDVLEIQLNRVKSILHSKADEYSTDHDRLHNFKQAAYLQDCTSEQALGGMLAKHLVSIYDLIGSEEDISMSMWDEKITDAINYLILLKALIVERATTEGPTVDPSPRIINIYG